MTQSFLTRRMMMTLMASAVTAPAFAATPTIIATTGMIADAAARLTGLPVTSLMGPGMDPHGYRQTRSDIAKLARADLVLWHGLYLEAQMEEFLLKLRHNRPVIAVAEALPPGQLRGNEDYANRFDPHVWMDPALWGLVVQEIARALSTTLPGLAPQIAAALPTYQAEIAALDSYSREVLASVPPESRILVSAHDAFGYFGRAYDFEVQGIQGLSTNSEAGLSRIAELVDLLVARQVPAVFVETSVSDRAVRALIEGAAAKGHSLHIGGTLYSDAMGPEGSYEGTWLGMIDANVTTIARALGGQAPKGGRLGQLESAA